MELFEIKIGNYSDNSYKMIVRVHNLMLAQEIEVLPVQEPNVSPNISPALPDAPDTNSPWYVPYPYNPNKFPQPTPKGISIF